MDFAEIVDRLDLTRARLEAEITTPAVIAVTSATPRDGTSMVATGLAHGLAAVGHHVLLVDGNVEAPTLGDVRPAPRLSARADYDVLSYVRSGTSGTPSVLALVGPGVAASCSRETAEPTIARLREHFTYTVIETAALPRSGMALALACAADGVIIALKQGRAATDADQELVKILRSAHASILGVVTTQQKMIRAFEAYQAPLERVSVPLRPLADEPVRNGASLGVRVG